MQKDVWLGVKSTTLVRDYNPFDSSLRTPLQEDELMTVKSYSDQTPFVDGSSFDFDYGQLKPWAGPCLYLKASIGYSARDAKCSKEYAFACEWKSTYVCVPCKGRISSVCSDINYLVTVPVCPTGYIHRGHLSDGRTCISILGGGGAVPNTDGMCRDPAVDELREPFLPKSPAEMELLTELMRYTVADIDILGLSLIHI